MPGLNRSGPMGAGPMTGGRRGICGRAGITYDRPVYGGSYGNGRGMGFRRGYGSGCGRGSVPVPAYGGYAHPQAYGSSYATSNLGELEMLRADAEAMQKSLEAIQGKIAELEKEDSE